MELKHFSEMMQPVLHDSQFHEITVFLTLTGHANSASGPGIGCGVK